MFELRHGLLERVALDADEVGGRDPDVGEPDLAEVSVGGHVGDRADLDPRRVHRDDHFADPAVGRPRRIGATDQVAVVGRFAERRPDLLAVDDEVVAVADCGRGERGEVGAGVGFGHPDAPGGLAGEHAREELGLLIGRAVVDQRRAHLAVREPQRGDGGAGGDEFLADDQAVDVRAPAAAVLGRPGHPDPAVGGHLLREVLREAVDPRIVVASVPLHRIGCDLAGVYPQLDLFGRPGEVHHHRW